MPFFSVVIPVYNKSAYVGATLNTVLDQTFTDFEIIVVNDGSTDDSLQKIESINDGRLTIVTIENSGVSHARNVGVEKASANYIVFLDADDLWQSNHLQVLRKLIKDFPDCGMYCTGYYKKKSEKSNIRAVFGSIENRFRGVVKNYFENSLPFTVAGMGAVALPKTMFESFNGFTTQVTHGEDIELWTKIALEYDVTLHNIATVTHQLHVDSRASDKDIKEKKFSNFNQFKSAESSNPALKRYLDHNRYAIALRYRLAGNETEFKSWMKHVNNRNLNMKQKALLKLPVGLLMTFKKTHRLLLEKGLYLSTYR